MNREQAIDFSVVSLSSGERESIVHSKLLDSGFSGEEAEEILQVALDRFREIQDEEKRRQKLPYRIAGLALCVFGIGMMVYSYTSAKSGGMYVVPGGIIGYGIYLLATGTGKF